MKLGLVSAILDQSNFEEMIDYVSECGLECVEVACWPAGKVERRYAGVSHIDVDSLTDDKVNHILEYAKSRSVSISALGYYPNPLDANAEKSEVAIKHLYKLIDAAEKLNVNTVTTFIGRDQNKTISQNLELVKEKWIPLVKYAESKKVKIAIENCPMLFSEDEWPGGQNLMTTPDIWRKVFEILDSENIGLNYDPSHFVWQGIDYIKPLYEFKDKIFHVHYKDIKVYRDKLNQVGYMATPLQFMAPKLPGLGDIDWGKYVSALTDINYKGYTCIEVEDKAFEDTYENVKKSILISTTYLRNYIK